METIYQVKQNTEDINTLKEQVQNLQDQVSSLRKQLGQ